MRIDAPKNQAIKLSRAVSIAVYLNVLNSEARTLKSLGGSSFSVLRSRVVIDWAFSAWENLRSRYILTMTCLRSKKFRYSHKRASSKIDASGPASPGYEAVPAVSESDEGCAAPR